MTLSPNDVLQVDALLTDQYLDSLLAAGDQAADPDEVSGSAPRHRVWFLAGLNRDREAEQLDLGVRMAADQLTRDLPRFHPSFRFEERLAVRLAEAAASMRLAVAAGGDAMSRAIPFPNTRPDVDPLGLDLDRRPEHFAVAPRPLLVGGAVAASALSLAGAAWVAWRRSRAGSSPMARAARAAHALRHRSASAIQVGSASAAHGGSASAMPVRPS